MELIVNGEPHAIAENASVTDLVAQLGLPDRGVAVAVDDAVVPKGRWTVTTLGAGQRVEILTAVQGG